MLSTFTQSVPSNEHNTYITARPVISSSSSQQEVANQKEEEDEEPQLIDNEDNLALGLSPQERLDGLLTKSKNLYGCTYLYDDWGSANYDAACQGTYYLYSAERDLIASHAQAIMNATKGAKHMVDFGCGTGAKILPLLKAFSQGVTYYPVDISHEFLEIVQSNIYQNLKDAPVQVKPIEESYTKQDMFFKLTRAMDSKVQEPIVFSIFGAELMCVDSDKLEKILDQLHTFMRPQDTLIVGYDPQKENDVGIHVNSYDYPESHEWFKNIVHNLGHFLNHPLCPDDFDYVPRFETANDCSNLEPYSAGVVHYLRSRKDMDIPVLLGDRQDVVRLRSNELMYMLHSAKPTRQEFVELMQDYGFALADHFEDDNQMMGLCVFRKM